MQCLQEVSQKRKDRWTTLLVVAGAATTFGSSLPVGYNIGVVNTPADVSKYILNYFF